ncbi:MAG: TDT family transporter [Synergistaceae bacterium]|nr:TDT family transporter [Synergistaceae bacterium]
MDFLKRYPLPAAGLILALFGLGDLLQSYDLIHLVIGCVAFALYVLYLLKLIVLCSGRMEPVKDPVAASILPAFTMATMLLARSIKPCSPTLSVAIWYAGLAGHIVLIFWFSWKFLRGFSLKNVLPSWFVVYAGIAMASASAPVVERLDIGRAAFWFALASFLCLLPLTVWRVWKTGKLPDRAKPTAVIFAMPLSLLLTGYMTSFEVRDFHMVQILILSSTLFFLVGLGYLMWLTWKQPTFVPEHAAFTFPLVISALSTKTLEASLSGMFNTLSMLTIAQTVLAVLVILKVLVPYLNFKNLSSNT